MKNLIVLSAFLAVWAMYLIALYVFSQRMALRTSLVSASHLAPSMTAVAMSAIFVIGGGSNTAQFAAGSEGGMQLWNVWFDLWLPLLGLTSASAVLHLAWAIAAGVRPVWHPWFPVATAGMLVSCFAFYAAAIHMPDA